MNTLAETLNAVSARISDYRERRVRLTESDTIRVLILPVLKTLGWDLHDVEEVRSEYRHASTDNPVDYALFLHASPTLFVEAKALGVSLDDRKPLIQTLNYANVAGVDWCVLTNGAEWRIYKVHAPVAAEEKLFLAVRFGDAGAELSSMIATLSLLSRDRMQARAIDALWFESRVDREVEQILDTITHDDAFIRLVAKRATNLTPSEVRSSLRRSGLRSFYPPVEAFMARLDAQPDRTQTTPIPQPSDAPANGPVGDAAMVPTTRGRFRLGAGSYGNDFSFSTQSPLSVNLNEKRLKTRNAAHQQSVLGPCHKPTFVIRPRVVILKK